MANTIKIKRGLSSNINNTTLAQGELAITTDTQDLYVGTDSGNKKVGGGPKNILDGNAIGSARAIARCVFPTPGGPESMRLYIPSIHVSSDS